MHVSNYLVHSYNHCGPINHIIFVVSCLHKSHVNYILIYILTYIFVMVICYYIQAKLYDHCGILPIRILCNYTLIYIVIVVVVGVHTSAIT